MARSVIRSTLKGITQATTRNGKIVHESNTQGFPLCGKRIFGRGGRDGGVWYTDEDVNCPHCLRVRAAERVASVRACGTDLEVHPCNGMTVQDSEGRQLFHFTALEWAAYLEEKVKGES